MQIFTHEFKNWLKATLFSKKTIISVCVVLGISAAIAIFFIFKGDYTQKPVIEELSEELKNDRNDVIYEYGIPISDYDVREGSIKKGEFFSTLLSKMDVSQNTIYQLTQKCKGVFDLKQIKVGNKYQAYFTNDSISQAAFLVYERDGQSFVVFSLKDSLYVKIYEKDIRTTMAYAEVTINTSLWEDTQKAGVTPILALKLSDIYAWSIDFFGLQKGDSFKALYEVMSYKGDILDIGKVKYAVFNHLGKEYTVYQFDEKGTSNEYWNEKGESMRKAFLKAPLNYTRISSGFSYNRVHPITRKVRPHTGVDYAAPIGTPVVSIGDGVVVEKGYKGGGGNTVKIKHNSVYTSAYLHLSKYGKGIVKGARVTQGQIIGYVGSTGSSTGPHLDFRIWKNGTPINPLKMESPPTHPINKSNMDKFLSEQESAKRMVRRLQAEKYFNKSVEILGK